MQGDRRSGHIRLRMQLRADKTTGDKHDPCVRVGSDSESGAGVCRFHLLACAEEADHYAKPELIASRTAPRLTFREDLRCKCNALRFWNQTRDRARLHACSPSTKHALTRSFTQFVAASSVRTRFSAAAILTADDLSQCPVRAPSVSENLLTSSSISKPEPVLEI